MIEFKLNPNSGVPKYQQVQDQIRFGIASGQLVAGEQLPTVRALAVELSVNPNTIIKAYTELERMGVLTTEQGSGTFVAPPPAVEMPESERVGKLNELCAEFLAQVARYGFSSEEVINAIETLTGKRASQ